MGSEYIYVDDGKKRTDTVNNVHAFKNLAENNMTSIEPAGHNSTDELGYC